MRTNKNKELERLSQLYMKQIETAGIHFVEGRGKLLDAHTVEVNGQKFTVGHAADLTPLSFLLLCGASELCKSPLCGRTMLVPCRNWKLGWHWRYDTCMRGFSECIQ